MRKSPEVIAKLQHNFEVMESEVAREDVTVSFEYPGLAIVASMDDLLIGLGRKIKPVWEHIR